MSFLGRQPRRRGRFIVVAALVAAMAVLGYYAGPTWTRAAARAKIPDALPATGAVLDVHDPSAAVFCGGFYYLYSTGINVPARRSKDLIRWEQLSPALSGPPIWAVLDIPAADGIWAPDLSQYGGRYLLYYAISTFGNNKSDIGLSTNATLDPGSPAYEWKDEGKVIGSDHGDSWNAIDPSFVQDSDGNPWLVFGSFWGGIKLARLDPSTGKLAGDRDSPELFSLARRPESPDAIEAPFIVRREGWYYLFASYDFCCRAAESTYNIRVGRSGKIMGPYLDRNGIAMMEGGGTKIAESSGRWRGPGGESIFGSRDGRLWIAFHAYDRELGGTPTLRIYPLVWDSRSWPIPVAPIAK